MVGLWAFTVELTPPRIPLPSDCCNRTLFYLSMCIVGRQSNAKLIENGAVACRSKSNDGADSILAVIAGQRDEKRSRFASNNATSTGRGDVSTLFVPAARHPIQEGRRVSDSQFIIKLVIKLMTRVTPNRRRYFLVSLLLQYSYLPTTYLPT